MSNPLPARDGWIATDGGYLVPAEHALRIAWKLESRQFLIAQSGLMGIIRRAIGLLRNRPQMGYDVVRTPSYEVWLKKHATKMTLRFHGGPADGQTHEVTVEPGAAPPLVRIPVPSRHGIGAFVYEPEQSQRPDGSVEWRLVPFGTDG